MEIGVRVVWGYLTLTPAIVDQGGLKMPENNNTGEQQSPDPDQEQIPLMQRVLDNPFLLLVLGIAMPTVFYIIWGIIEITQIPIAD
jgi:hypothetical protein